MPGLPRETDSIPLIHSPRIVAATRDDTPDGAERLREKIVQALSRDHGVPEHLARPAVKRKARFRYVDPLTCECVFEAHKWPLLPSPPETSASICETPGPCGRCAHPPYCARRRMGPGSPYLPTSPALGGIQRRFGQPGRSWATRA